MNIEEIEEEIEHRKNVSQSLRRQAENFDQEIEELEKKLVFAKLSAN